MDEKEDTANYTESLGYLLRKKINMPAYEYIDAIRTTPLDSEYEKAITVNNMKLVWTEAVERSLKHYIADALIKSITKELILRHQDEVIDIIHDSYENSIPLSYVGNVGYIEELFMEKLTEVFQEMQNIVVNKLSTFRTVAQILLSTNKYTRYLEMYQGSRMYFSRPKRRSKRSNRKSRRSKRSKSKSPGAHERCIRAIKKKLPKRCLGRSRTGKVKYLEGRGCVNPWAICSRLRSR